MLQELSIKDFAIIPTLDLSFENGMTVLTGETGAGKSIIIDAVGLLAGGRSSVEYIREGTKKATLQGLFSVETNANVLPALEEYGIELDDNQVLISREIHRSGRNVIRINGVMVNGAGLRKIGQYLVDIHGQNEHQELMKVDRHEYLLDQFAQKEVGPVLKKYQSAYSEYRKYFKLYQQRRADEQAFAQRLDMLNFQVNELQEAHLIVGEEEQLNHEYQELSNFQDVLEALSTAYEVLAGDWEGNGLDVVSRSVDTLERIEELSPRYQKLTETVRGAYFELQEATSEALSIRDNLEFDAERLTEVTDRLNLINTLENKYGTDISEILKYQATIEAELAEMTGNGLQLSDLKEQAIAAKKNAQKLADQLTNLRQAASVKLATAIHQQLADLYMEKAVFSVHLTATKNLQVRGQDQIEFYIQTNPGESAKPLAKIASGGELSRMMLAMKTIFARDQGVTSIIFDEVDTGVSGRVAQSIANKIAKIASYSQVLTITHLPQVAAVADHHLYIEKNIIKQRTVTTVKHLNENERIDELARMLSGDQLTDAARANARDLLTQANS
ncbi:DNA repair protein [Weissella koreensis KACC 15510]|uniref:DNA repair protein RecN n=1 Tax=Weissella koreensis TaxID=165096 RepID=UPI000217476E|nr:DNA repair protein RecN [Weissella koreensis]AEJ23189.1 DNA repair protein [Weissella koreensis KACC 15510]